MVTFTYFHVFMSHDGIPTLHSAKVLTDSAQSAKSLVDIWSIFNHNRQSAYVLKDIKEATPEEIESHGKDYLGESTLFNDCNIARSRAFDEHFTTLTSDDFRAVITPFYTQLVQLNEMFSRYSYSCAPTPLSTLKNTLSRIERAKRDILIAWAISTTDINPNLLNDIKSKLFTWDLALFNKLKSILTS